jgi:hypothetical protein
VVGLLAVFAGIWIATTDARKPKALIPGDAG